MSYTDLPVSAVYFFLTMLGLVMVMGYTYRREEPVYPASAIYGALGWGAGFAVTTLLYYSAMVTLVEHSI